MAFRQHGDARHAAWLEMMQMDVQQRCSRGFNAAPQRRFDMIDIIEALGAVQIDDQMHAGAADAIANSEVVLARVVLPAFRRRRNRHFQFGLAVFLASGAWSVQAFHRSQEGVSAHAVLPNQGQQPEMPARRRRGKRKPLDQSTRTDQQRLNPHINAISGESRRFCNQTFNALSRSLVRDVSQAELRRYLERRYALPG